MFNPYHKLNPATWEQCLQDKTTFLVTQTFRRAFGTYRKSDPTCLLLTPYTFLPDAMQHFRLRDGDPMAALLRLNDARHLAGVERLLDSGTDYTTYWSVIPNEKAVLDRFVIRWELLIRSYMAEYTGVYTTTEKPGILHLEQYFGELTVRFDHPSQSMRFPLEDVEREMHFI